MANMNFRLDRATAQQMLDGTGEFSWVGDMLHQKAEAILSAAQASAPVKSGNYRDGLKIVTDRTDRMAVRVVGTAPHSHLVEAATGNLARAIDAAAD